VAEARRYLDQVSEVTRRGRRPAQKALQKLSERPILGPEQRPCLGKIPFKGSDASGPLAKMIDRPCGSVGIEDVRQDLESLPLPSVPRLTSTWRAGYPHAGSLQLDNPGPSASDIYSEIRAYSQRLF